MIYDGQRRLLAAQASAQLAGTEGYEDLTPVQSLIVLLLDHEPVAGDRCVDDRAGVDERVEFAVLAARVDMRLSDMRYERDR